MHAIARLIRKGCAIKHLPDNFYMVRLHSLGGIDFDYLTRRGAGTLRKLKKGGGNMVQGQFFLKGGAGFFPI